MLVRRLSRKVRPALKKGSDDGVQHKEQKQYKVYVDPLQLLHMCLRVSLTVLTIVLLLPVTEIMYLKCRCLA